MEMPKASGRSWAAVVFGVIWTVMSCLMVWGLVAPLFRGCSDPGWKETPCVVTRFETRSGPEGSVEAEVSYRYEVAGTLHTGHRLWPDGNESRNDDEAQEIRSSGGAGEKAGICRVNPGNPDESFLRLREFRWNVGPLVVALLPGAFCLLGIWMIKRGLTRKISHSGPATPPFPVPHPVYRGDDCYPGPGEWTACQSGDAGPLTAVTIVTVIWNGFGCYLLLSSSSAAGRTEAFLFVLAGFALIAFAISLHSRRGAPLFEIRMDQTSLLPGEATWIRWRYAEGREVSRKMAVLLVGEEVAVLGDGSTQRAKISVFHEEVIFESSIPEEMRAGGVELALPWRAVPTFAGKNARIRWAVAVICEGEGKAGFFWRGGITAGVPDFGQQGR